MNQKPRCPKGARLIPVSNARFWTIVDAQDYRRLSRHSWSKNGAYVYRYVNPTGPVLMHHVLCPPPEGFEVDHRNLNKMDNRRSNLRIATRQQNECNKPKRYSLVINGETRVFTSQFKGVLWSRCKNKWRARVKVDRSHIHLGYFTNEVEAAKAYDAGALIHHGEFARTNKMMGLL